MSETGESVIRDAARMLSGAGVENASRDARLLLRWVLGLSGAALSAQIQDPLSHEAATRFREAVSRRAMREPISHITGTREFWGRAFEVNSHVLDPRPETEVLISEALHRGPFSNVLDLGTGSGCILLTLLSEWPNAFGTGCDISEDALGVARSNGERLGVIGRCIFRTSDWYTNVNGRYDLIISNPPYIAEAEMPLLAPEVLNHEPAVALSPGGDGQDAYRRIAEHAAKYLNTNGTLMVEIGPTQSLEVSAIFANAGLLVSAIIPDMDNRPRAIIAHL